MVKSTGISQVYWKVIDSVDRLTGEEAGFLSEGERSRLAGLRFEKRRSDWLLGRWTAKRLLAESGVLPPGAGKDAIQIENEPGGRPFASWATNGERLALSLSISHRAGRGFCALSWDEGVLVGADIEKVEPKEVIFVEDYLGESERGVVERCPVERRDLLVTLAWSAKESLFKALGTGLRLDTRQVEVANLADWMEDQRIPDDWNPLQLLGQAVQEPLAGWAQKRQDFVLTLVVLGTSRAQLVECKDAR